jgi:uncharacterized protein YciI
MPENEDKLKQVYALIWKASVPDSEFKQEEFESRIPRLMVWLKDLYAKGKLAGCGGGGYENHAGGLTLITADNIEEALLLSAANPMNEIGSTEIMVWDVYYANLILKKQEKKLKVL